MSYTGVYVTTAFFAGIILALSVKDVVASLSRLRTESENNATIFREDSKSASSQSAQSSVPVRAIADGIEGTIGNTPLLRIKSLSDATGCEILAKAEVRPSCEQLKHPLIRLTVSERSWWDSKRSSGIEHY